MSRRRSRLDETVNVSPIIKILFFLVLFVVAMLSYGGDGVVFFCHAADAAERRLGGMFTS